MSASMNESRTNSPLMDACYECDFFDGTSETICLEWSVLLHDLAITPADSSH